MTVPGRPLVAAILVGGVIAMIALPSDATLEGQVFTSDTHRLRMTAPRGWRPSDQPTYPGVLLWMRRSKPPGLMLLTSETIDDEAYCSWPAQCRQQSELLAAQYACALAARLEHIGFKVGPVQTGPRDGELSSVWFEYEDGKKFMRQGVATDEARAHTLILSTSSSQQRGNHVRAFDQALRSMHPLAEEEVAPPDATPPPPSDAPSSDAYVGPDAAPGPGMLPPPPPPPHGVLTRRCDKVKKR